MAKWRNYIQRRGVGRHTVSGTLKVLEGVHSPQLGNERDLLVYLPPSYKRGDRRYPVIYMHDGQNLFDEATSYAGEWQVDETLQALSNEGLEAIVVGIPNMGRQRVAEYTPFRVPHHRTGRGERYLAFIVETVKPLIDRDFRTLPERAHTGIIGSSLGGLISLYAFFRYPQVFGLSGAFSPAFELGKEAMFSYVQEAAFVPGKVYMDVGTREAHSGVRDTARMRVASSRYLATVQEMRDLLQSKGYRLGVGLLYVEEEGALHHESAWARRLPDALRFLLS